MVDRWFAVVAEDGGLVSVGTVVADPLPDGLSVVEVDGPADGRVWLPDARLWGAVPDPVADVPELSPAAVVLSELASIAADQGLSRDARLDAILARLAAAAEA